MTVRASDRPTPALEAKGLSKRFGSHLALSGVDLRIERGEVVALLGENGSGKSTLVKILAGYHTPEPGARLEVAGERVPLPVPHGEYRRFGLSFVYQDLGLALGLRVRENLFVSQRIYRVHAGLKPIRLRAERRRARTVLASYDVKLEPDAVVGDLRQTDQALLAIVRAAEELRQFHRQGGSPDEEHGYPQGSLRSGGVLVLDEPTVFLPQNEKIFLFDLVKRVTADGASVLFISHDLVALRQIAHRAVVLRDGVAVGDMDMERTDDATLVERISGHRIRRERERAALATGTAPQSVNPVVATPETEREAALTASHVTSSLLREVSLEIGAGEIVGVAGLLGSGADDLPYVLFGALSGASGTIRVSGRAAELSRLSPRRARELGLALVPADRKRQGLALQLGVGENVMSLVLGSYFSHGLLARRQLRRRADDRNRAFGVRPPDSSLSASSLSGGNQQRVLLARWLEHLPAVLLLHEPTQGVDVGTRADIYTMMRDFARDGLAVLWVSTDFDELAAVSHRVLVITDGVVTAEMTDTAMTGDRIAAEVYTASTEGASRLWGEQ